MKRLGVNIDHIATIRNARRENHPNIVLAAKKVMKFGADLITIHLREDRRHINDKDLKNLSKVKFIPINLELSANEKMIKIALKYKPNFVCLVPEKRKEITTEGGLNLKKNKFKIKNIEGMNFNPLTREWNLSKNFYPINYFCTAELI